MASGPAFAAGESLVPLSNESIGVIGCSNTRQHVEGYTLLSDADKFWLPVDLAISGGTVAVWAANLTDSNPYWANFSANLQKYGASSVWIQMCIRGKEASSTGMTADQQSDLADVIKEAERRTQGVPVYVSPLNDYASNDCPATGLYGVPNAKQLADWAAATGLALRGPDTGPLSHSLLAKDLCHLNEFGLAAVGEPMVDFFDVVEVPDKPPLADFTYSPARPLVNEAVTFQDLSTDDGTIVSWTWSFGGLVRTGRQTQFKFLQAGTYEVTLTVTDDNNNVAISKKLVTVRTTLTNR
ncbi:MAG TPA: PKD domain-containing protein [Acidimicrobiia bacterium]|nr:PKD domain-containing protein [Acidimicrobiia bacterium]